MRNWALILVLLPSVALAGGPKYSHPAPPGLDDEFQQVYHDIAYVANGTYKSSSMTLQGLTVDSVTVRSQFTPTGGIVGTTTNDDAAAGNIGKTLSCSGTFIASAGNGNFADICSIPLTAGDWEIFAEEDMQISTGVGLQYADIGVSTTAGNSGTGLVYGDTALEVLPPSSIADSGASLCGIRASLASGTTYYLKFRYGLSSGTPRSGGRMLAVRVRK